MSYPRIFSKNYINRDGTDVLSSGASTAFRSYDWDQDSQWVSVGSDDLTVETFEHIFYEKGTAVNRTFDTVILINHNLKKWKLQYWDGSAWQDSTAVYTTDSGDVTFATITEVASRSKIRLYMEETQVADEEKKIGEFLLCNLTYTFTKYLGNNYKEGYAEASKVIEGKHAEISKPVIKQTLNRFEKFGCRFSIDHLSDTDLDSLRAIKKLGEPFIFYPFGDDLDDDKIFFVEWLSAWNQSLSGQVLTGVDCWTVDFVFREV